MPPAGVKSPFAANADLLKQPRRPKPQITELTKVKQSTKEMDDQMKALQNRIAFLQQQSGLTDKSIEEAKRKTQEVLTKRELDVREKAEMERQKAAAAEAEAAKKAPLRPGDKAVGATLKPSAAVTRSQAAGGTSTRLGGRATEPSKSKMGRAESRARRPAAAQQVSAASKESAAKGAGSKDENLDPQIPMPTKQPASPETPPRTADAHVQDKGNVDEHPISSANSAEGDTPNIKIAGAGWQSPEGMHPNLCIRDYGGTKVEKGEKDAKEKVIIGRFSSKRPVSASIKSVTETNKAFRAKYTEPQEESDDDNGGVVVFETGAGKWA